ncbi:MAG: dockerin type I repeat-containing protein [Spirochaetales bacterium]|nr:dockerin type I repeat-containing protein [Spirochaetales bacterium]
MQEQEPTPGQGGDVNSDGRVDIVDALLSAQFYVGLNPADFDQSKADVNCDGSVDIVDALLIAQYYVGLITDFCE